MIKEEPQNKFTKIEISLYTISALYFILHFPLLKAIIMLVFSIFFVRATIWDYKHQVIPLYLVIGIFFTALLFTNKEIKEAITDGLIFIGACFILNQLTELYQDLMNYEESNTLIGEGDIPIIGAIGIILEVKVAISCIVTAIIIMIILNFFYKKKELAFLPFLAPSFIFYLIFKKEFVFLFI